MSGLAKQLYNSVNQPDETDEFGIPIGNTVDYLVERALAINRSERATPYTVNQLYTTPDGVIHIGREDIAETSANARKLTAVRRKLDALEEFYFWKGLKKRLPQIDYNIIQVSPHIFWDKQLGELISEEDLIARYKKEHKYDHDEETETE